MGIQPVYALTISKSVSEDWLCGFANSHSGAALYFGNGFGMGAAVVCGAGLSGSFYNFQVQKAGVSQFQVMGDGRTEVASLAGSGNRAVYSTSNGSLTNSASDQRLKNTIEFIPDPIGLVERLRGIFHLWNDPEKYGQGRQLGMLAQEVQQVLPEIVGQNVDGMLSVDYPKLSALLIEVVKRQQDNYRDLISRVDKLESER
jgi:hypothetical protein